MSRTPHSSSHHPLSVKEHTIVNMYETADSVSSNSANKQHSERMVDELLLNNGPTLAEYSIGSKIDGRTNDQLLPVETETEKYWTLSQL